MLLIFNTLFISHKNSTLDARIAVYAAEKLVFLRLKIQKSLTIHSLQLLTYVHFYFASDRHRIKSQKNLLMWGWCVGVVDDECRYSVRITRCSRWSNSSNNSLTKRLSRALSCSACFQRYDCISIMMISRDR